MPAAKSIAPVNRNTSATPGTSFPKTGNLLTKGENAQGTGRDRPIIMSAPMVRSIRREIAAPGTGKTQHRLILDNVPESPGMGTYNGNVARHWAPYLDAYCSLPRTPENPRGMSDLWCWWTQDDRMGWEFRVGFKPGDVATIEGHPHIRLPIVGVSVHRIKAIKGVDIIAEGFRCGGCYGTGQSACRDCGCWELRGDFERHWTATHGPHAWADGVYVAAITFRPILANIALLAPDPCPAPDSADGRESV